MALRYFNVYGPRQDPHSDYAAVIPKFITHLAGGEQPLIYGDGDQTRDFVYVKDVVQANMKAMESQAVGTYNVGCGEETSVNNLAETMIALFGSSLQPRHTDERPGEVKHSVADISRAKKDFGYSPDCNLENGLEETLEFYDMEFRNGERQNQPGNAIILSPPVYFQVPGALFFMLLPMRARYFLSNNGRRERTPRYRGKFFPIFLLLIVVLLPNWQIFQD